MTHQNREEEALDALLDGSAPHVSAVTRERSAAMGALLDEMHPARPRRSWRTWAAFGGAALLLGAGGVATAESRPWESWWADDAVTELSYTLPSGAVCTGIIGGFAGPDETVAAAEDFMAQSDLIEVLEPAIVVRLAEIEDATTVAVLHDGSRVDAGPGTVYWSDDEAYRDAVSRAASEALIDFLEGEGLEVEGLEWEGEERCPGSLPPASTDYRHVESHD